MIGFLQLVTVLVIVPFLTYRAIGFYVSVMMALGHGFKLWGGLLDFHPIELGGIKPDEVVDHVMDWIDETK